MTDSKKLSETVGLLSGKDIEKALDESKANVVEIRRTTSTASAGDVGLDELYEEKGYLHKLARGNNFEGIKEFVQSYQEKLQLQWEDKGKNEAEIEKQVENLLREKLDELDDEGLSALHYAARYNNIEAVKTLVEHGAEVDVSDKNKATPLHAIARGRKMTTKPTEKRNEAGELECVLNDTSTDAQNSVMSYLMSKDANPNQPDDFDQTPLHYATFRGNTSAVRFLLNCHETYPNVFTNPNCFDKEKQRPLHLACNFGWSEICDLLIEKEADVFHLTSRNRNALHFASSNGECNIMKRLLETAYIKGDPQKITSFINQKSNDYESPLTLAISNGKKCAVELLLEHGANIKIKQKKQNGVLHVAASVRETKDSLEILQILVDKGASLDLQNIDDETPLHAACLSNNVTAVEFLISQKANIEARDKSGRTPFLLCCQMKPSEENEKIFNRLTEAGANLETSDNLDKNAAALAAKSNNIKALELVLSKCSNIENRLDRNSNSPLHIAARHGKFESVKTLVKNGSLLDAKNENEETPLHLAVKYGFFDIVKFLIEVDEQASSQTIRDEDQDSNTPIHLAAKGGYNEILELLLVYAKDLLEARNALHFTPLGCAVAAGKKETVQILLNHGAKLNNPDDNYTTPLHEACKLGKCDIVSLLLNSGAYIDTVDTLNRNCLEVAIDYDQPKVAKLLVENSNWKDILTHSRTRSITYGSNVRTTPLRELIKAMPEVAEMVLDKCVTNEKSAKYGEITKVYNYEFVDDVYSTWTTDGDGINKENFRDSKIIRKKKSKDIHSGFDDDGRLRDDAKMYSSNNEEVKKNHPIMLMVTERNTELLGHDLVTSLLNYKWTRYGQIIYYTSLFFYVCFVGCLTHYAINVPPPYTYPLDSFHDLPNDYCLNETLKTFYADSVPHIQGHVRGAQYMTMLLAIINLVKEAFQFYFRRKKYFMWTNLVEILLYIFSLVFVVDLNVCSQIVGYRMHEQWLWGVRAVILAWMNLIMMIRKFSFLGIYVVMFTDVLRTFAKFFVVFFLFIIAFALGFFMLFQNQAPFTSFARTIVKTLVMMVGEFEYNAIFYSPDTSSERANYPQSSQIIFMIFAIIMTILIMNLLVGLAVDDIKTVKGNAVLQRQAMKAELMFEIEFAVPECIRRRWMIGRRKFSSDTTSDGFFFKWLRKLFPKVKDETPTEAVVALYGGKSKEDEEREEEENGLGKIMEEVNKLKQTVTKIESRQDQMLQMVGSICNQLNLAANPVPQ